MKLIAVVLLLLIATSAGAFHVKSGDNVTIPAGTALDDDVLASGNQINILGNVDGSVYAAGANLNIEGGVTGSLAAAGNTVTVGGQKAVVTVAGRSIQLVSLSARNVAAAGSDVMLDSKSRIDRDAYLTGSNVTANGTIGRELWLSGGNLSIGSKVGGNVHATGQKISILPGAVIRGNVIYSSPNKLDIPSGAQVLGKVIRRPYSAKKAGPNPFAMWLLQFVAMWIFGAVFISLFPRWSAAAVQQLRAKPGWSALWGLVILIVAPIAIILALVTIVGIPLAITGLAAYVFALLVAGIITSITVGRIIARNASIWLQLVVGLLILSVISAIPVLGGLVRFAVILFGLGALALSLRRPYDRAQGAPAART